MEPWLAALVAVGSLLLLALISLLLLLTLRAWARGGTKGSDIAKRLDGQVLLQRSTAFPLIMMIQQYFQVVVITGANTGIGKPTAEDLYRRGAR